MAEMEPTPNIPEVYQRLRKSYDSGLTRPIEYRIKQLRQLHRMLNEEFDVIAEALRKDLGKVFLTD
jgi:acyl-CoA reductase-like NAD-dependent aldehyde dehydrogenase